MRIALYTQSELRNKRGDNFVTVKEIDKYKRGYKITVKMSGNIKIILASLYLKTIINVNFYINIEITV